MRSLTSVVLIAAGCAVAAASASAGPNAYYASPSSTDSSGGCAASAPCTIDHAIGLAGSGDVVVVMPGTYTIRHKLSTSFPITIEGQPGQPRPSLVGDPSLDDNTLQVSGGAVVRHLDIETHNDQGDPSAALSIDGGTAEDLVLVAGSAVEGGEALKVMDSSAGTVVRTVLAINQAEDGSAVSFADDKSPGTANAYSVTAINTGDSGTAIASDASSGTVWVKDSIAYSTGQGSSDVASSGQPVNLTHSDFRPSHSSGYADQGANILAAPVFVNASARNYREAEASSTIDAGATDPALTSTDLDGNPRVIGSAPDMGAYEFTGGAAGAGGAGGGTGSSPLPRLAAPVLGVSVSLRPVNGTVQVEVAGHRRFVRLNRGASVPVGSVVDVTRGAVSLTSVVNRRGTRKSGVFQSGRFVVTEATGDQPTTDLRLIGGSFAGCSASGAAADRPLPGGPRPTRRRTRVVRQLWGTDSGGSFVTIGNTASAAVRGTVWLTQDTCDGTLVRVLRGAVVVHDDIRGRDFLIHRGQAYFARARG